MRNMSEALGAVGLAAGATVGGRPYSVVEVVINGSFFVDARRKMHVIAQGRVLAVAHLVREVGTLTCGSAHTRIPGVGCTFLRASKASSLDWTIRRVEVFSPGKSDGATAERVA